MVWNKKVSDRVALWGKRARWGEEWRESLHRLIVYRKTCWTRNCASVSKRKRKDKRWQWNRLLLLRIAAVKLDDAGKVGSNRWQILPLSNAADILECWEVGLGLSWNEEQLCLVGWSGVRDVDFVSGVARIDRKWTGSIWLVSCLVLTVQSCGLCRSVFRLCSLKRQWSDLPNWRSMLLQWNPLTVKLCRSTS